VEELINMYIIEGREFIYNSKENLWEGKTRSSFPNPLEQLKLILSFGEFQFIKFAYIGRSKCYLFSFKPNVYFLDPLEITKPEGFLWILQKNGLPISVKVSSEKDELYWEMNFSNFNSFASINVPLKFRKFRILDIQNEKNELELLIDRIIFLGYKKPDIEIKKNDAILSIRAEGLSDSLLKNILKKGELEIFIGEWPKDPIYKLKESSKLVQEKYGEGAKLFFEKGIVTKPIIAVKKILSNDAFNIFKMKNDMLGKYSIYGSIKPEMTDSLRKIVNDYKEKPVVFVVDDYAVSISFILDNWLVERMIPITKGLKGNESIPLFAKLKNGYLERDYNFRWEK